MVVLDALRDEFAGHVARDATCGKQRGTQAAIENWECPGSAETRGSACQRLYSGNKCKVMGSTRSSSKATTFPLGS